MAQESLQFHPDRGGDATAFKQELFAYEGLSGRWQASSASTGSQSGQRASQQASNTFEQSEEFRRYAQAYYDAWYSVPDNIRFWFSFFNFLHGVSLIFAFPLFFGWLAAPCRSALRQAIRRDGYSDVHPCGCIWRARPRRLHEVLGPIAGRPSRQEQLQSGTRVTEQSTRFEGESHSRKPKLRRPNHQGHAKRGARRKRRGCWMCRHNGDHAWNGGFWRRHCPPILRSIPSSL